MKRELIEARLKALEAANGLITAEALVDSAKDPDDELHEFFEWDNEKAGAQWRLEQARALIRSVTVTITNGRMEMDAPCYVHVASDKSGYRSLDAIKANGDVSRDVVLAEFARAAAALRRAKAVAGALQIENDVEKLIDSVSVLRTSVEQMATA